MGSYVKCMADRYEEVCDAKRSVCMHCRHVLCWYDLIPVVSYVLLKGRCRYCGEKIPASVFVIELGLGLFYVFGGLWFGIGIELAEVLFLGTVLVFMAEVDRRLYLLPDRCQWLLLGGGLVFHWNLKRIVLMAAVLGFLLLQSELFGLISGKEAMGGGDIKLYTVSALYVGLYGILCVVLLSSFCALIYCLVTRKGKEKFAFGPWIGFALLVVRFLLHS